MLPGWLMIIIFLMIFFIFYGIVYCCREQEKDIEHVPLTLKEIVAAAAGDSDKNDIENFVITIINEKSGNSRLEMSARLNKRLNQQEEETSLQDNFKRLIRTK